MASDPQLVANLQNLVTRLGTEFKAHRTLINGNMPDLSGLTTTQKSSLVAAINELQGALVNASGIDDTSTSTTTGWSSQHITDKLAELQTAILGGASAAFDTLKELQDAIAADGSGIAAINTALANRLRVDADQGLTSAQQLQGRTNLDVYGKADIGNPATDFVALLNGSLT